MLAKLLKFVLLTRFSKPLLALIAFFLVYDILLGVFTGGRSQFATGALSYYAVGASIFFMTMSLLFGGLFIIKSDRDYLLTLPLTRRALSFSLFVAQFVGYGLTILFLYGFYVAGAGDIATIILLAVNLGVLACVVTSLGVISNILKTWKRVFLAAVLAVWSASSIFGFQLTPVSSFRGDIVYGSIALFVLAAAVMPVALRELANIELGSIRTLMRTTASEYKKNVSFAGKGPIRAVYSYHLSFLELVGRMNVAGSTSYRATRIKTRTVLLISIPASIAYLILTNLVPRSGPIVFVLPIFMGVIVLVLMAQGTLANERAWLAFTALDPATYLRHLLLSRVLSTLAIIGPFGIADIIIAGAGDPMGLRSALVLLVTIPVESILATYVIARVGGVYQVKEEGMMPGEFNLRQFGAILPIYAAIGLIIISEYSALAAVVIAPLLTSLATVLLASSSVWRGLAYRLTERGFI